MMQPPHRSGRSAVVKAAAVIVVIGFFGSTVVDALAPIANVIVIAAVLIAVGSVVLGRFRQ